MNNDDAKPKRQWNQNKTMNGLLQKIAWIGNDNDATKYNREDRLVLCIKALAPNFFNMISTSKEALTSKINELLDNQFEQDWALTSLLKAAPIEEVDHLSHNSLTLLTN